MVLQSSKNAFELEEGGLTRKTYKFIDAERGAQYWVDAVKGTAARLLRKSSSKKWK